MQHLPAIDEALRKAGVVWVDLGQGSRVVWHLWHDGAVWLVCGGLEQELPGAEHVTASARLPTSPADTTAPRPATAPADTTAPGPATAPAATTAPRQATVTVRGKDDVHAFTASVSPVEPGSEEWAAVVPLLHEKRLNPPDGEAQPERWARESMVLRLTPSH